MSDKPLRETADEFRAMIKEAEASGALRNMASGNSAAPAAVDPDVVAQAVRAAMEASLVPAVKAAVADAMKDAMPDAMQNTAGDAPAISQEALEAAVRDAIASAWQEHTPPEFRIDPELVSRLEGAVSAVTDSNNDVLVHMRTVLPGQLRQEITQQGQQLSQRLASLEQQVANLETSSGIGRRIGQLAAIGLVVAAIVVTATVFERPLRRWGQDNLFPAFGMGPSEARPARSVPTATEATPSERRAPALGQR